MLRNALRSSPRPRHEPSKMSARSFRWCSTISRHSSRCRSTICSRLTPRSRYLWRSAIYAANLGALGSTGRGVTSSGADGDPVVTFVSAKGSVEIRPAPGDTDVRVDGVRLDRALQLSPAEVDRGVILTVARAFAFCLHHIRYPVIRSPNLGLGGSSDASDDVRNAITRAAGRADTVLIRGESGTGKELVARALHESRPGAKGPFVAENASRFQGDRADDVVFGHERGAFT